MSVSCVCHLERSLRQADLVQRSPTESGVSECDREAFVMKRQWPTGGGGLFHQWGVGFFSI